MNEARRVGHQADQFRRVTHGEAGSYGWEMVALSARRRLRNGRAGEPRGRLMPTADFSMLKTCGNCRPRRRRIEAGYGLRASGYGRAAGSPARSLESLKPVARSPLYVPLQQIQLTPGLLR